MTAGDRGRKAPEHPIGSKSQDENDASPQLGHGSPMQRMQSERSAAAAQISRSLKQWNAPQEDAASKSDDTAAEHDGSAASHGEPTHVAAKLQASEPIFRAIDPKTLALAKKYDLNASSETSMQILNSMGMTCKAFIAAYRKASISKVFPGEFLDLTVQAALDADRSTVRKLLTDGRFVK